MAILFLLPPCIISVNTQIIEAVMLTYFKPIQSIVSSNLAATRIKNDAFCMSLKHLACIPSLQTGFYHPHPSCSHKLLLQQTPFSLLEIFEVKKLRSESKMTLKRTFIILTLVSYNASILNLNESQWIQCVSMSDLYLSTRFMSMSIDNWRYNRLSCWSEETKGKHIVSMK